GAAQMRQPRAGHQEARRFGMIDGGEHVPGRKQGRVVCRLGCRQPVYRSCHGLALLERCCGELVDRGDAGERPDLVAILGHQTALALAFRVAELNEAHCLLPDQTQPPSTMKFCEAHMRLSSAARNSAMRAMSGG